MSVVERWREAHIDKASKSSVVKNSNEYGEIIGKKEVEDYNKVKDRQVKTNGKRDFLLVSPIKVKRNQVRRNQISDAVTLWQSINFQFTTSDRQKTLTPHNLQ